MSEDELLAEALPHVEPEPKPKTKLEQFIEKLSQYPDRETAKQHIQEIADKIGCAKSLGYKALKKIEQFKPPEAIEAKEPTVKIPEAKPEPIEETIAEEEVITEEAPEEITPQPPEVGLVESETIMKLKPILERSVERAFDHGIEMASGMENALTSQESRDTATLLPFLIWRITKQKLNEDNFIDLTCVTHFGSIAVKIISQKLKERRKEKPIEKPPETPKQEPPKEEPKQETPKPKQPPPELPKTAPFLEKL